MTVLAFGLVSSPLSYGQSNQDEITNLGQEVSNFVHESRETFENQKSETKEVISQCREDLAAAEPTEREAIRQKCKSDLDGINESYRSIRETYRETFLTFKENMKVLIAEAKGLPVTTGEINAAISNIQSIFDDVDKQEVLRELRKKINEEIKEVAQKLRELEKKERELAREEIKAEKRELREQLKEQRETLKEQAKMLREDQRESRSETDEDYDDDGHDEDFIIKGIATIFAEISEYFDVDDERIYLDEKTKFDDFDSLEEIQGFNVKVKVIQSSNSLIAKEIEIEEDEHDEDHEGDDKEVEIEVEVENGRTKIKVKYDGEEEKFQFEGELSQIEAAAKILEEIPDFPHNQAEIMALMHYDIEDSGDHEDDDEHDDDHEDDD